MSGTSAAATNDRATADLSTWWGIRHADTLPGEIVEQHMTRIGLWVCRSIVGASLLLPVQLLAQTPATVSATCKDGTSFSGATRSGACKGHGGVQTWAPSAAASTPATKPATAPTTPTAPATPSTTTPAAAPSAAPTPSSATPTAGQVWVNTPSKVYHCPGDRYYGKTKAGKYMSEADAKAQGNRPSGGKACS